MTSVDRDRIISFEFTGQKTEIIGLFTYYFTNISFQRKSVDVFFTILEAIYLLRNIARLRKSKWFTKVKKKLKFKKKEFIDQLIEFKLYYEITILYLGDPKLYFEELVKWFTKVKKIIVLKTALITEHVLEKLIKYDKNQFNKTKLFLLKLSAKYFGRYYFFKLIMFLKKEQDIAFKERQILFRELTKKCNKVKTTYYDSIEK